MSSARSFHLIHGGFYFILFVNEINLKTNYCSTHTFLCILPGFKRAGSIIEANIKYIKQQMETCAGLPHAEFFLDKKLYPGNITKFSSPVR